MRRRFGERLDRIGEAFDARSRQKRLSYYPLVLRIYDGEEVTDAAFNPVSGKGPLILQSRGKRPRDHCISERDRPFIVES